MEICGLRIYGKPSEPTSRFGTWGFRLRFSVFEKALGSRFLGVTGF